MGTDQKSLKSGQMAKAGLKVSDPKVLIWLSIFLVLIGGVVIDPLAGFICFVLAGILALIAGLRRTRRLRYVAFVLLIMIIVLAVSKFPEASYHLRAYKSKAATGDVK